MTVSVTAGGLAGILASGGTTTPPNPPVEEVVVPRALLRPEQGVAVLLPDGMSAAVFLLHDGSLHAVGNVDPFYRAPVICHGIVGDRAGAPTVASPLGKQVFCLRTGRCLDDPSVSLPVFTLSADDGVIRLSIAGNNREIPAG